MDKKLVLYLDILGFKNLLRSKSSEEIYEVVNTCVQYAKEYSGDTSDYSTIYYSDTLIFWQKSSEIHADSALRFLLYAVIILIQLLAKAIPVRGAISYDTFIVRQDASMEHNIFFGEALIEAYETEKKENWIGITCGRSIKQNLDILGLSSKLPIQQDGDKPIINEYLSSHLLFETSGGALLLNPFGVIKQKFEGDTIQGSEHVYSIVINAIKFLNDQANMYLEKNDYTSKEASKYYNTMQFLKRFLGRERYSIIMDVVENYSDK